MNNKYIISLSFGNYLKGDGGVDKTISEHQKMFNNNGIHYLNIAPVLPEGKKGVLYRALKAKLYTIVLDGEFCGVFDERGIGSFIEKYHSGLMAFHIHHLKKYDYLFLEKILQTSDAPKYLFIHDYYMICEHPNLLKNNVVFCGVEEKKSNNCRDCIYFSTIDDHQMITKNLLNKFKDICVIAPSEVAAKIWASTYLKYIEGKEIKIIPHQIPVGEYEVFPPIDTQIRIAFIGRFGENKRSKQWVKFINFVNENNLPFELFYFGFSDVKLRNVKHIDVRVGPDNPNEMTNQLRKYGINCVFLWSICPETYSYTYNEAFSSNAFVITYKDSGNIAAKVQQNRDGAVFDSIDQFNLFCSNYQHFKQILSDFTSNGIRGPLFFSENNNVLGLIDETQHFVRDDELTNKVPFFIKTPLRKAYLTKYKY